MSMLSLAGCSLPANGGHVCSVMHVIFLVNAETLACYGLLVITVCVHAHLFAEVPAVSGPTTCSLWATPYGW